MNEQLDGAAMQEALILDPSEILNVPVVDNSLPNMVYPDMIPFFDPDLYIQNDKIIGLARKTYSLLGGNADRSVSTAVYPITSIDVHKAIQFVGNIQYASPIHETLSRLTGVSAPDPIVQSETSAYIEGALKQGDGPICIVSPTHLTDLFVMDVLVEKGINLVEVGLLVIDQHVDAESSVDSNGQLTPSKGNFLLHLLKRGIGSVSVVGVSSDNVKRMITGNMITNKSGVKNGDEFSGDLLKRGMEEESPLVSGILATAGFHRVYTEFSPRFSLADGYFVSDHRTVNNPNKLVRTIEAEIAHMKKNGVKYLFVSFDMDSMNLLNEEITATQYNPATAMVAMGLQNLQQILDRYGENVKSMENRIKILTEAKMAITGFTQKRKKKGLSLQEGNQLAAKKKQWDFQFGETYSMLEHIVSSTVQFNSPTPSLRVFKDMTILNSDEGGFYLPDAKRIIRAAREACIGQGVQFGIPVGGRLVTGSISELEGLDYKGNTARTCAALIREFNDI